jgi:hypothetical protein
MQQHLVSVERRPPTMGFIGGLISGIGNVVGGITGAISAGRVSRQQTKQSYWATQAARAERDALVAQAKSATRQAELGAQTSKGAQETALKMAVVAGGLIIMIVALKGLLAPEQVVVEKTE